MKWLSLVLISSIFIFFNVFFNYNLWSELFENNVTVSDNIITEYLVETSYQNILHFKNPYIAKTILYPFTINFSMNDSSSAFVLPFFLLRPFLDPHKSIILITLVGFFLNNVLMYLLMRKFKINKILSALMSLVFGYMPFFSHRIQGHYSYIHAYFFPLIFILILNLIENHNLKKKALLGIGLGISLSLLILTNLYYFFIVLFGIVFYLLFYFYKNRQLLINTLKDNVKYFSIAFFIFFVVLIPWIPQVFQLMYFDGFEKQVGFAGSPILSADVISFLTPSEYNPIYKGIFSSLPTSINIVAKYQRFFFSSWERFAYPGVIILSVYVLIIFFKKKLRAVFLKKIQPHFLISLVFALLSMGPFFKIFNRWALPLGDGISFVLPLPFIILHYFPILNSLRAPMRFNPGFVFLATIVSAFVINYFLNKINSKNKKYFFYTIIFIIFIFDQGYNIPSKISDVVPNLLYKEIRKEKDNSTVLEIPFTVRDGFKYLGFVHSIGLMNGPLIYERPVIGGYLARLNTGIFSYYENLPFLGYILKITDKGNYNPTTEKPKPLTIFSYPANIESAKKEVDFLNIKYIILKNNEKYSENIKDLIKKIDFVNKSTGDGYDLYTNKKTNNESFESVNFGSIDDSLYIAGGFSSREDGYRWAQGGLAKVFVKTNNTNNRKLIFEALSFYKPQKIRVYINKRYVGEKEISIERNKYIIDINGKLDQGINTIYFKFTKSYTPSKLWSHDQDTRDLAVKFFTLKIE